MVNSLSSVFHDITSFNSLYRGYREARKGKRTHPEVLEFAESLEENILELSRELRNGSYSPKGFKQFTLYDPKERNIFAPYFRDRVLHRSIYECLEPFFHKKFIHDSYACRRGKGTHGAVDRAQYFMRKQDSDYFLKCDVKSYFDSVNHGILTDILSRYVTDSRFIELIKEILQDYRSQGLPIGTLYAQLFANVYLDKFDHFVKQKLQASRYLRYMDDFVFFSDSKERLHELREACQGFLRDKLELRLPFSKTTLEPVSKGLTFLGYRIFPGKRELRKRNRKKFRRRLNRQRKALKNDEMEFSDVRSSVESWKGHSGHADAENLREAFLDGLR